MHFQSVLRTLSHTVWIFACTLAIASCGRGDGGAMAITMITPDDKAISYSDCVHVEVSPVSAIFDRLIDAASGIRWDNPGARIRFNTDARTVTASLFYDARHNHPARNGNGTFLIDGKVAGHYTSQARPGAVRVSLQGADDGKAHLYELILPYADSVQFNGLEVSAGAKFFDVPPRPKTMWLAYGDSITEGYLSSDPTANYPSQVGDAKHWQVTNMGFGGRQATGSDGLILADMPADIVTVLMGANDAIAGKTPEVFKADVGQVVANIRAQHKNVPIYIITPLCVPAGGWNNLEAKLEPLRAALRVFVAAGADKNLHLIEGPDLIPHEVKYCQDGLHPNDEGFRIMAANLCAALPDINGH